MLMAAETWLLLVHCKAAAWRGCCWFPRYLHVMWSQFADQFVLGQKGGKWEDPEHVMCARPGRESTPPMFCTRNPRRSARGVPGTVH